jgi:hypothetical protein
MITVNLEQKWAELEGGINDSGYWRIRINPEEVCEIFLAIEKPSNKRVFLLEVKAQAIKPGAEFPQSKGFDVALEAITPGQGGKVRIALKIKEMKFKDVFTVLVDDVVQHITGKSNQTEVVAELVTRLLKWQIFLKNTSPDGLSDNEQTGLYGELWFLKHIVLERIKKRNIIKSWSGPYGANQDFQFEGCAVEVKSTTCNSHEKIKISNIRQLDATGIKHLLLFHISLDVRMGGVQSLPEIVNDIRNIVKLTDPENIDKFNDALIDAGYLDIHEKFYCERRYEVRFNHFFYVEGSFPRILEKDLLPGVGDVSYSIELSACLPFEINTIEALRYIKGENAE